MAPSATSLVKQASEKRRSLAVDIVFSGYLSLYIFPNNSRYLPCKIKQDSLVEVRVTTMQQTRNPFWLITIAALLSLASATDVADYIIVGAGTSGLALANRLSQNGDITVALVDPGADERNNSVVKDPAAWLKLLGSHVDWGYSSIPQVNASGRVLGYNAGKGIGGTSLINGMLRDKRFWYIDR